MLIQSSNVLNGKNYIEYILIFSFIVLLPFENSALQGTALGLYGASLSVIPIILIFTYRLICNKIEREFFYLFYYSIFIFFIGFFIFSFLGYSYSITLIQPLKNFLLFLTWFYCFFYFKNMNNLNFIKIPIKILFYLMLIIIFLTVFLSELIQSISFLNYVEVRNAKYRGFSLEASTFGFLMVSVFLTYIICFKKKLIFYLPLIIFCLFIVQSKGGIISLLLTFIFCSLIFFKRNFIRNIIYIIVLIISYFLIVQNLKIWFASDIEMYTSVATRSTLIVLGLISIFLSPIGWSFSGYYPYFYENLSDVIFFMKNNLAITLNYNEVYNYSIVGNFQSVGTKSFIFDCIIVYGISFVVVLFLYLKNIFRFILSNNDYNRLFALIFILIALSFYNSAFGMYIGALLLGLIFNKNFEK